MGVASICYVQSDQEDLDLLLGKYGVSGRRCIWSLIVCGMYHWFLVDHGFLVVGVAARSLLRSLDLDDSHFSSGPLKVEWQPCSWIWSM